MKRRDFLVGLAGVPVLGSALWGRAEVPENAVAAHWPCKALPIQFDSVEADLHRHLTKHARQLSWFGAPILSKTLGKEPGWVNLVGRFRNFGRVKQVLFEVGVEPISTPELPGSFIKFHYRGRLFNVVDCELDTYCQSLSMAARQGRLSFAHDLLVFDVNKSEVLDPSEALAVPPTQIDRTFALLRTPANPADAFDALLTGWFQSRMLQIPPCGGLEVLEQLALKGGYPQSVNALIAERIINYFPDIYHHLGSDLAGRVASSSSVREAMRDAVSVDFSKVFRAYKNYAEKAELTGAQGGHFLALLHRHAGSDHQDSILEGQVGQFMASNDFGFRCPEWLRTPIAA